MIFYVTYLVNFNNQLFAAHTISFKVKNFDSTTFNGLMYPSYACKYQKMPKNEPNIGPFDLRPGEKVHFFQDHAQASQDAY